VVSLGQRQEKGRLLDERYARAIEAEELERANEASVLLYSELVERDAADDFHDEAVKVLPDGARAALRRSTSVGFTDLSVAPTLVPFFGVQVVTVCDTCARNPEKAARLNEWLAPMLDAGLAVPVLPASFDEIDPTLLSTSLRGPWLSQRVLHALALFHQWQEMHVRPCGTLPSSEAAKDFRKLLLARTGHDDPSISNAALLLLGRHGEDALREDVEYAQGLNHQEYVEFLLGSAHVGRMSYMAHEAAVLNATPSARGSEVDLLSRALEGVPDSVRGYLEADAVPERVVDIEISLSLAEQLGIAYDPMADPREYIETVAPYAGFLSNAIPRGGSPDESDLMLLASTAREINDSVMRMRKVGTHLNAIAAGLSYPAVKALVTGGLLAGVNPWIAACGAGGIWLGDTLRTLTSHPDVALKGPDMALRLLQRAGAFPPGTYAVYDLRRRTAREARE
jgi:hypothetical protein